MSIVKTSVLVIVLAAVTGLVYLGGIAFDWYGELEGIGQIESKPIPTSRRNTGDGIQNAAAQELGIDKPKQILFGDLHVHTTFSSDAFRMSLPMVQGDGAHPPADACDFARVCSSLDFWALTDHAESLTQQRWQESIESVQQCNATSGDSDNPDMVTFMGFEWTQAGATPETHYGHKNIIFPGIEKTELPARPIGSPFRAAFSSIPMNLRVMPPLRDLPNRQRYYDFSHLIQTISQQTICPEEGNVRDFPADCSETAKTPADLFRKLNEWELDSLVIPHGNTWGVYSPAGTAWDKQLAGNMHDPKRQTLLEIYSGHGNSEEYRDWRAVDFAADGSKICPPPRKDYLPSCWQAGELIRQRCLADGLQDEVCEQRAITARNTYLQYGLIGWHTVPGTKLEDWLDSGQCRDCFLPSLNYRPGGSSQYSLAVTNFDKPDEARRFRFGFIASSDNHTARPGAGYKQYKRHPITDWWGYRDQGSRELYSTDRGEPEANSVDVDASKIDLFNILELERGASFFVTSGLVAVHAEGRNRDAIWNSLKQKEVYGTSGQRMLLWFDLVNPSEDDTEASAPMGSEVEMNTAPRFQARAIGAFKQKPGCPDYSLNALSPERLDLLCRGECYNPSSERQAISKMEVIRIRPQMTANEPVTPLIEDPWKTFDCDAASTAGCEIEFSDPEFETLGRDAVYYVRALQQAEPTINGANLRCELDDQGECIKVNACYGDDRTASEDNCLAEVQHRAWSSPIFIDYASNTEASLQ
jgi:hypothetical protein